MPGADRATRMDDISSDEDEVSHLQALHNLKYQFAYRICHSSTVSPTMLSDFVSGE